MVASEVRKLAEPRQLAASEIHTLSGKTVEAADQASSIIAAIVPDIQKTASLVQAPSFKQGAGLQGEPDK